MRLYLGSTSATEEHKMHHLFIVLPIFAVLAPACRPVQQERAVTRRKDASERIKAA